MAFALVDLRRPSNLAAFYADCLHEVLPVTAGCRLTLVYNLIRRGKGNAPRQPNYTSSMRLPHCCAIGAARWARATMMATVPRPHDSHCQAQNCGLLVAAAAQVLAACVVGHPGAGGELDTNAQQ